MARLSKSINTTILEQRLVEWIYLRGREQRYTIAQYEKMLALDPVISVANTSLKQGIIAMLGEYQHDNPVIKDFVNQNFAYMTGVLQTFWLTILSFISHGTAIAHIKHVIRNKQAWLDTFTFIAPDQVVWKLKDRQIEALKITGVDKEISYLHVFHLINEPDITPGKIKPGGNACCAKAYKYWELEELLFTTLGTIGQKQSAKLLVGKIPDTDAQIELQELDPTTGVNKISTSGEQMMSVLEATENSSVVVCEVGDEIEAIDQTVDGQFFDFVFHDLRTQRFLSFYQSQTTHSGNKSGVGDAGLADSQKETLLSFQESKAVQLGYEFIEQVIRPLVEFNFGTQDNYGHFAINRQDPKALTIASLVLEIMNSDGVIPDGQERASAYEKLKTLVGM
jgi:hypothetical protein